MSELSFLRSIRNRDESRFATEKNIFGDRQIIEDIQFLVDESDSAGRCIGDTERIAVDSPFTRMWPLSG